MYKKNKKFSLIELLLVMVISAIMLGIVIPTFHKITKGVNVEAAARQLGAQLKAVREYAITKREYVALIMEGKDGTSKNLGKYKYVAYRPCVVTNTSGTTWSAGSGLENSNWVEGERWEFLPDGAEIKEVNLPDTNKVENIYDDKSGIDCNVSSIIIFSPTGKCEGLGATNGSVTVGETIGSNNETQNHINITIAAYTGRVSYGDQ